jgi:hypothetical protein
MSKLINGYPLVFLPDLAVQYGLNEAIVIQQIHYWANKLKPSDDGFTWVYNTIPEWKKQFPFWSERTIFSILKNLREIGVLVAERKSENPWDQTLFYRLDYEKLDHPISQSLQDGDRKNCKNTIKTETTQYIAHFDEFWKHYPKKIAKANALKAWSNLKPDADLTKTIIDAIKAQRLSNQEIQFVPYPASWLNARRWEDEITPTPNVNHPIGRRVI